MASRSSYTKHSTNKFCKVCYDSGKSKEEYTSHFIRETPDKNSKVVCPTLLSLTCQFCKGKGHTPRYCPVLKENTYSKQNKPSKKTFIPVFVKKGNGKKELKTDFFQNTVEENKPSTDETKAPRILIDDVEISIPKDDAPKKRKNIPFIPRSVYTNHFELLNDTIESDSDDEEDVSNKNEESFPSTLQTKKERNLCGAWNKPLSVRLPEPETETEILETKKEDENTTKGTKPFSFKDILLTEKVEEDEEEEEEDKEEEMEQEDQEYSERMEWGDYLLI